jgi:hypothetical protein
VTITVAVKAVAAAVNAGGTVTTGTGAVDAGDPLHSAVTPPAAATITIAQGVFSASQAPAGYTFLNQQVNIAVVDPSGAEVTATAANPIVLSFALDRSLVPPGQDFSTIEMFRNGVRIPACPGQTVIPAANLDPCVTSRAATADGDVLLTIITSHASRWNMGVATAAGGAPVAMNDGPYHAAIQTPIAIAAPGVLANDFGRSGLTATVVAGSAVNGVATLMASGAFTFAPSAGACGASGFGYTVTDESGATSNVASVSIVIECNPRATDDAVTVFEDSSATAITVLANDTDPDAGESLSVVAVTPPANGLATVVAPGIAVAYTPNPDFFGADSFTYTASDGHGGSATATVNVTVAPVNDAPRFVAGGNRTVLEDGGAQTVANWATNISAGPANESSQAVNFVVSSSNPALFSVQPAVGANGTLTFTPAANANGSAIITAQLHDSGGTANGGIDTSAAQAFTVTVSPVNDAPHFTKGADQAVAGAAGAQTVTNWATLISAGPNDEAAQALNFIVTSNNSALFAAQPAVAANGTLSYTPAANVVGSAIVTVSLHDNGGTLNGGVDTSAPQTFTISVNAVATTTTLTSSLNPSVLGVAVTFTAAVTAAAPGAGTPSGTVTFKDGAAAFGSATLDATGKATFATSSLAAATHSITAAYGGATMFVGSTSAILTQSVGQAAPTIATSVTKNNSTPNTAVVSPAFPVAAGTLLVAFISADGPSTGTTNTQVNSMNNSGTLLTWTRAARSNLQRGDAEIWWTIASTARTSITVTGVLNLSNVASMTVVGFTGASPVTGGGVATANAAQNSGVAPAVSLTTTRANSWVYMVATDWDAVRVMTPAAGQTMVSLFNPPANDTYWVQRTTAPVAASGTVTVMSTTYPFPLNDRWNAAAIEIRTR